MPPAATPSALPSAAARAAAFVAILLGGLAGGLVGWGFVAVQCEGDCGVPTALGALVGSVGSAVGVAVVAVLVLRAMSEWRQLEPRRTGGTRFS